MQFEKLDIVNLVVVIGIVIALIAAIFFNRAELSTTIAAGLLGFLGGFIKANSTTNKAEDKKENITK